MSFDWADYLVLADSLVNSPHDPGPYNASLRSSISRAYYACYCSVRNFTQTEPLPHRPALTGKGRDHGIVIGYMSNASEQVRRRIGQKLERLIEKRHFADYDDVVSRLHNEAKLTVEIAHEVFDDLERILR